MKLNDLKNPYIFFSSGFGIGLIPIAPGTFGSGFGLCLYIYLAHFHLPTLLIYLLLLALLMIAWFAINESLKALGKGDHQAIVIDEIIGMMFVASVLLYALLVAIKAKTEVLIREQNSRWVQEEVRSLIS